MLNNINQKQQKNKDTVKKMIRPFFFEFLKLKKIGQTNTEEENNRHNKCFCERCAPPKPKSPCIELNCPFLTWALGLRARTKVEGSPPCYKEQKQPKRTRAELSECGRRSGSSGKKKYGQMQGREPMRSRRVQAARRLAKQAKCSCENERAKRESERVKAKRTNERTQRESERVKAKRTNERTQREN